VSFAASAGIVATLLADGATELIVVVLVEPRTSWLVAGVMVRVPLRVSPAKVGDAPLLMFCGRESVIAPVAPEAITWFAVPVIEVTPVLLIVIDPAPLVIPIAVPAVRLARVSPEPLPIKSLPFPAVDVSSPVPPRTGASCVSEWRMPPVVV
jgi:hypothetical protein